MNDTLTAVPGVRVGHAGSADRLTGCTVVLFERPALAAVDARGGAPGTLDTDHLGPSKSFPTVDAILLTGGSAFGIDAAAGVRAWLAERDRGWKYFGRPIPLVSAAVILDLGAREGAPDAAMGRAACDAASTAPVAEGNAGAGWGATVGKLRGLRFAMKGGVGSATAEARRGIRIGAIVVANPVGNVGDLAGTRRDDGRPGFTTPEELAGLDAPADARGTTIGVVVTNAKLQHGQLLKVTEMAHDGLARAVRPAHMTTDGDTLFAASTGDVPAAFDEGDFPYSKIDWIGHAAANCVEEAVRRAVRAARTVKWPEAEGGVIPGVGR